MKGNTKKDIVVLLNVAIVIGLVVVFFSQPLLLTKEPVSLFAIADNLLDYEIQEMKDLIMSFDKEFMFGLLNVFVLPFAILSLIFMTLTKVKSGFRVGLIVFSLLTLISAGIAFYAGFTLAQTGKVLLTNFSYVYLALGVLVPVSTVAFFKV